MTEETPAKKPRRKRRTKAEIEAEKAAKEAAVVKEEKPTAVTSEEAVKEEPAVSVEPTVAKKKEKEEYIPLTGLAKLRSKYAQRGIVDRSRGL